MSNPEQAVRLAAKALHLAISEATKHGLVVTWPRRAADLPQIAISEVAGRDEPSNAAEPQSKPKRRSSAST